MNQVYPGRSGNDQSRNLLVGRVVIPVFLEHAAQQVEICPGVGPVGHPDLIRGLPDPSQDDRRVPLERRAAVLARFGDYRLERGREAIGWRRRRPMIVNDAASRCFEGAGERRDAVDHVVVDERLQLRRLVSLKEAADQKKQLRLALAEIAHTVREQFDVALLLANGHCRRMLAGGGEERAIGWARNLDEALRSAAHGANLLAESRAAASGAPFVAQGTNHVRSIV